MMVIIKTICKLPKAFFYWAKDIYRDELMEIPNRKKYVRWERYSKSLGYFDCSPIMDKNAVSFYITKYITKELCDVPKGIHLYAASRGLNRPELIYDDDADFMLIPPTYNGEYCKVAYDKYQHTYDQLSAVNIQNPFTDRIEPMRIEEDEDFFKKLYNWADGIDGTLRERYNEDRDVEYENMSLFE